MQPDGKPPLSTMGNSARGPRRTVEMFDTHRHLGDETSFGLGQPHAAMPSLEQNDTKRLFQRLDPGADARLRNL